jgi:hypothetical protein
MATISNARKGFEGLTVGTKIVIDYGDSDFKATIQSIRRSQVVFVQYDVDNSIEEIRLGKFWERLKSAECGAGSGGGEAAAAGTSRSSRRSSRRVSQRVESRRARLKRRTRRKKRTTGSDEEWVNSDGPESAESSSANGSASESEAEMEELCDVLASGLRCNECKDVPYDQKEAMCDVITFEKLDKKHIEWVSPDGRMKQCYNMSTLIQIACKSTGLRTLKQPPHFRCPMDQKMKMQIENKFPGVVQKIEGAQGGDNEEEEAGEGSQSRMEDYYVYDDDDYRFHFRTPMSDNVLNGYFSRYRESVEAFSGTWLVGNLYVCPICIKFLSLNYEKQENAGDSSDDGSSSSSDEEEDCGIPDPLSVLSHLGCDVGASACTRTIAEMKSHLKEAHGAKAKDLTKVSGCMDVLKRFRLREADGLIQSYCHQMENMHQKTYWSANAWFNRGTYNLLQGHVINRAEYLVPELFAKKPVWENTNEALLSINSGYSKEENLKYFREVLLSKWSHRENADDESFIKNSSSSEEGEEDEDSDASTGGGTMALFMKERLQKDVDELEEIREELNRKSAQKRRQGAGLFESSDEEESAEEFEKRRTERSQGKKRRQSPGLVESSEGEDRVVLLETDESGDEEGVQSSQVRRTTPSRGRFSIGDRLSVFYRSSKQNGGWYDAKLVRKTPKGITVLYKTDGTIELIKQSQLETRVRRREMPKLSSSKTNRSAARPANVKNKSGDKTMRGARRTFNPADDSGNEVGKGFYVCVGGKSFSSGPAAISPPSTTQSAKKRRIFLDEDDDDDDEDSEEEGSGEPAGQSKRVSPAPKSFVLEDSEDDD